MPKHKPSPYRTVHHKTKRTSLGTAHYGLSILEQLVRHKMASNMFRVLLSIIKEISVEPVLILNNLAMVIYMIPYQIGLYHVICYNTVHDGTLSADDPEDLKSIDCWKSDLGLASWNKSKNSTLALTLETTMQEATATWTMLFSLAYTLPCIFADIVMGAYSDMEGRKYNIIIGLVGTMISQIPWAIIFNWPAKVPLFIAVIGDVFAGLTGFVAIINISAAAYIADTVVDGRTLTLRMTILAISIGLANIIGPLIAKELLKVLSYSNTILVSVIVQCVAVGCTGFVLKQIPPKAMRKIAELKAAGSLAEAAQYRESLKSETSQNAASVLEKLRKALLSAVQLVKSVWFTFTKKRQGHRRSYLLVLAAAVFFSAVSEAITGGMIMTLFVQKTPFRWDQNSISDYKSVASAISLIGATVGIVVFKKVLQLSDSLIILLSLISQVAKCLITSFSDRGWMLYMSAGAGILSPLLLPCVQSFVAKIVDADEVGKSYTAFSIGTNMAYFANLMVFTAIYRATVGYFAGLVYLLMAIFLGAILCLAAWVHLDSSGIGCRKCCGNGKAEISLNRRM